MFLLAASYDLTDYPAVRTVCIILSLILAGIVLAIAITNYIREGKAIRSENVRCGCAEDSESVSETLTEKEEASAEECETAISAEQTAEETVEPIEESLTEIAAESVEDAVCEEAEPVAEVPAPEADTESFAEEPVTEVAAEEKAESVAEPVAESAEVENEETARLDEVAAAAVEAPTVGEEQAPTESEVTTDYDALPVFFEKLTRNLSEEDKDAFAGERVKDGVGALEDDGVGAPADTGVGGAFDDGVRGGTPQKGEDLADDDTGLCAAAPKRKNEVGAPRGVVEDHAGEARAVALEGVGGEEAFVHR